MRRKKAHVMCLPIGVTTEEENIPLPTLGIAQKLILCKRIKRLELNALLPKLENEVINDLSKSVFVWIKHSCDKCYISEEIFEKHGRHM